MIRALLFDMDGTLIRTEDVKAHAYVEAVERVLGLPEPDDRVLNVYRTVAGASREVVSQTLVDQLGLEPALRPWMAQYGVASAPEVLTAIRTQLYEQAIADPKDLRAIQNLDVVTVFCQAKEQGYATGVATSSRRADAVHILSALDMLDRLDVVLTHEDVARRKPDPEIYVLAARKLGLSPGECLVIEDARRGVQAALRAGMTVVALATPLTVDDLVRHHLLPADAIVHDPADLPDVVWQKVAALNRRAPPDTETRRSA